MSNQTKDIQSMDTFTEPYLAPGLDRITPEALPQYSGGIERDMVTGIVAPLIGGLAVELFNEHTRNFFNHNFVTQGELRRLHIHDRQEERARIQIKGAAIVLDTVAPISSTYTELIEPLSIDKYVLKTAQDKDRLGEIVSWEYWMITEASGIVYDGLESFKSQHQS